MGEDTAYGSFSLVYDQLMDDFDYPAWAGYYLELIRRAGGRAASMAECGCGTGSLSIPLARAGIKLTALDLSADMLERAAEKARRAGVFIPFVRQDMRSLSLHRPVDAVVCACDGVNYLTCPEDALRFFERACASLRPGGVLAFDVSSRYKLEELMGDAFFGEERSEVAYLWQNRLEAAAHLIRMDLTFFVRQPGGLYRRFEERHLQRAHSLEELAGWLERAGFARITAYGDRVFDPPAPDAQRIHITAVRPE